MNRRLWMSLAVSGMLLLVAAATRAQDVPPPPPPFGGPMELLGFEGGHAGHNVKGAPYSAKATSETTQTLTLALADGTTTTTKIHRTTQSLLYRDSQGRSRREVTLSGFGPLAASGKTHKLVTIADPVAGVHYVVDDEHQVVHKMSLRMHGGNANGATAAGVFPEKMKARMQAEEASGALKKESGSPNVTVNVNGVSASVSTVYTKITRKILQGEIGNDTEMQVVSERWYSPKFQIVVKSTRSDPRFGTTTYAVTDIQTTEPDASLFTIPADYTVKEGGPGPNMMFRHGFGKEVLPPPPPAPNN
jgi:hypothetical protein